MDIATLVGVAICWGVQTWAVLVGGMPMLYWDVPSVLITFGGTFGATLMNWTFAEVMSVGKVTKQAFFTRPEKPDVIIKLLVDMSSKARREGVLALEAMLKGTNDKFMRTGFQLIIDGQEPAVTESVLSIELANIEERHKTGQEILTSIATFGPAFGMIGTLIGLVQMLATMSDPSTIGPSMAVAIITTLYGAILANMLCLPLAGKLKNRSKEELLIKGLIAEAILAIQAGDNPRIVEQKLHSFIAPKDRVSAFDKR